MPNGPSYCPPDHNFKTGLINQFQLLWVLGRKLYGRMVIRTISFGVAIDSTEKNLLHLWVEAFRYSMLKVIAGKISKSLELISFFAQLEKCSTKTFNLEGTSLKLQDFDSKFLKTGSFGRKLWRQRSLEIWKNHLLDELASTGNIFWAFEPHRDAPESQP